MWYEWQADECVEKFPGVLDRVSEGRSSPLVDLTVISGALVESAALEEGEQLAANNSVSNTVVLATVRFPCACPCSTNLPVAKPAWVTFGGLFCGGGAGCVQVRLPPGEKRIGDLVLGSGDEAEGVCDVESNLHTHEGEAGQRRRGAGQCPRIA